MLLTTKIGVVRRKMWHDIHQILVTIGLLITIILHTYEVILISNTGSAESTSTDSKFKALYLSNRMGDNNTAPIKDLTECEIFDLIHNKTSATTSIYSDDEEIKTSGSFIAQIFPWITLAMVIIPGICLFTKHNVDYALVAPIVGTPEVIILIWAGTTMVILEIWLLVSGAERLFNFSYKVFFLAELILVVFMDVLVRVWHSFHVIHTLSLVVLMVVDMLVTVWFSKIDHKLICMGNNDSVVISNFMVQRWLYINMLTSLTPSLIVLYRNKKRIHMSFAEEPVARMKHATLLTEGSTGEEANGVLQEMTRKNILLAEKLKHVQKALFKHEFGGKSMSLTLEEADKTRTDTVVGTFNERKSSKISLKGDAVPEGCEDGVAVL